MKVTVNARLVQSDSHPLSNDDINKQLNKYNMPKGKLDKNRKPHYDQTDRDGN